MTHPLEAVACHLEVSGCWQNADAPTRLALQRMADLVRAAIPDCECGELVRETVERGLLISFEKLSGRNNPTYCVSAEDQEQVFMLNSEPTLAATVAAARANGAEGTPNA